MNRRRLVLVPLAAVVLLTAAAPAHAFRMIQNNNNGRFTAGSLVTCNNAGGFVRWNIRDIDWFHNTGGQGGNAGVAAALEDAMDSWTWVSDADHVLDYAGTTNAGWATDGQNTILWASGNGCTGNCLALTALVLQNQIITETDVTFNANYTWNTNGADRDVEAVAAHELGHSLGIHHTDVGGSNKPTMYATYFGTAGRSLHSDDRAALQCSEWRYCSSRKMKGQGTYFAGMQIATIQWNSCLSGANVDIFKNGVKVLTTPNDGIQNHNQFAPQGSANFWVCDAGSTSSYNSATCSNVKTLYFYAP